MAVMNAAKLGNSSVCAARTSYTQRRPGRNELTLGVRAEALGREPGRAIDRTVGVSLLRKHPWALYAAQIKFHCGQIQMREIHRVFRRDIIKHRGEAFVLVDTGQRAVAAQ